MAAVVDNRTSNYDIPLPNAGNWLSEDVIRLAQAITAFDQLIKTANDNIGDRALLGHAHQISEITGLSDALSQLAAYDHVHALAALSDVDVSIITVGQYLRWNGSKWVPGVVSADDIKAGTIDPARLPSIAITDTYVVASQAAMLGLAVQKGDIAVRTDLNRSFICSGSNPALLASWTELLTPTDAVLSVAGLTGAITASALRTAIATATGIALMTASNPAEARSAIGATAVGSALMTAVDGAAGRLAIGAEAAGTLHDDRYYTEGEVNSLLAGKQANLGYTPANKAGDTFTGPVTINGTVMAMANFNAYGSGAGGASFNSRLYGTGGTFFGRFFAQDVVGSHVEAVIEASTGSAGATYAFRQNGSFYATGSINGASKNFVIDHPLDPLARNLRHASIEAPELMVQYRGVATLTGGQATVDIDAACGMSPGTFAALTTDAAVQSLMALGSFERVMCSDVAGGVFTVTSEDSGSSAEVAWLVAARRNDAWVRYTDTTDVDGRLIVEEQKREVV